MSPGAAGKVEIGAFRTYPQGYKPPDDGSGSKYQTIPMSKIEDFGQAVQVKPIKITLKAPRTKRLKLHYDTLLYNFAFKFDLRRYTLECTRTSITRWMFLFSNRAWTLRCSTCCGTSTGQGLTLVHFSAQHETILTQITP